jgi:hypothetical protein
VTEMRSSPARSSASELNGGEGGGPVAQGAAPSSDDALGLVHREGREVSRAAHGGRCGENRGGNNKLTGVDKGTSVRTRCNGGEFLL